MKTFNSSVNISLNFLKQRVNCTRACRNHVNEWMEFRNRSNSRDVGKTVFVGFTAFVTHEWIICPTLMIFLSIFTVYNRRITSQELFYDDNQYLVLLPTYSFLMSFHVEVTLIPLILIQKHSKQIICWRQIYCIVCGIYSSIGMV